MACHNRRLVPPPPVRRPCGDAAFGDSEAPARLDGACGPQDRQVRRRRTGFGLTVAARAGGCDRPRGSSTGYSWVGRGEAVGEADAEPRTAALPARRTLHRPPCHGGELSASARHLAAFHRLPADRRSTSAPEAAPATSAACLRACVRCRACVSCAARPSLSACYVTCVWSPVHDVWVRGGARAPPHIPFIR